MPLLDLFSDISDPRVERTRYHTLIDILTIAVLGVLCSAEGFWRVRRELLALGIDRPPREFAPARGPPSLW
jgi:hypothetical protein